MNNEDKAKEIAKLKNPQLAEFPNLSAVHEYGLECAMKMAEYKDNEYSELIKRANENSTKQFSLGAEKERERVINAAAEWLDKNVTRYAGFDYISEDFSMADNFIKDFKKAVRKALK